MFIFLTVLVQLIQLDTKGCCFIFFLCNLPLAYTYLYTHAAALCTNLVSVQVYLQVKKDNMKYNQVNFLDLICKTWLAQSEENHCCFQLCNRVMVVVKIFSKQQRLDRAPVQHDEGDALLLEMQNCLYIYNDRTKVFEMRISDLISLLKQPTKQAMEESFDQQYLKPV